MSQFNELEDKEFFECDCGDMDHTLRMFYCRDETDMMYVSIHLRQKPWHWRLWHAIKYVFGYRSRYGDFDEFVWGRAEATKFRNMIDRYLNHIDNPPEK